MYKTQNERQLAEYAEGATENRARVSRGASARSSSVSRSRAGDRGAASGVFPKLAQSIYVTLAEERVECLALLERAIATPAAEQRAALLSQLHSKLSTQFQATEQTFYAALQHFQETQAQACEFVQSERELDQLLQAAAAREVALESGARRQSMRLLTELRDRLIAHASKCERVLFPEAHRVLPRLQEENLHDRYLERSAQLRRSRGPS